MCNSNSCFGGNNWIIILIILLLFCGNGNGCGNNCGCNNCGCNDNNCGGCC